MSAQTIPVIIWAAVWLNVGCAVLGGMMIPVIHVIRVMTGKEKEIGLRAFLKQCIVYPIPGGVLVFVYGVSLVNISAIVAFNIGLTGPAIIAALMMPGNTPQAGPLPLIPSTPPLDPASSA